jgi:hypothetical protein
VQIDKELEGQLEELKAQEPPRTVPAVEIRDALAKSAGRAKVAVKIDEGPESGTLLWSIEGSAQELATALEPATNYDSKVALVSLEVRAREGSRRLVAKATVKSP